jgi:K+-sensing histidine kinase KdpD
MQIVADLPGKLSRVPPGPWSDPPGTAVVLPIPSNIAHQLAGLLVLGVSSRLEFDDHYRGFFDLICNLVATAITNAEHIFEAFHTTKAGGIGMGLAISRSIVEAHGGHLWTSSNESPGANFHLTLPFAITTPV